MKYRMKKIRYLIDQSMAEPAKVKGFAVENETGLRICVRKGSCGTYDADDYDTGLSILRGEPTLDLCAIAAIKKVKKTIQTGEYASVIRKINYGIFLASRAK